MRLKVLLPFKVFAQQDGVKRIVAKTDQGFLGLLPHRLDCVAVLMPGILSWQGESVKETVVAVDAGLLVKAGTEVLISVRSAIGGTDLGKLHEAVTQEFMKVSEQEKVTQQMLTKLESGFISRFAELQHG